MSMKYLITGGAGFIGSNYVNRLLARGEDVIVYDNLSRAGAPRNLDWLRQTHGTDSFQLAHADIRDAATLTATAKDADIIVHLAGQVAVTISVTHPREDFDINALGTFNVVEAARLSERDPIVIYASTNKVYGGMEDVPLAEKESRWQYASLKHGCSEEQPLDFHSPYGCSKGAGDQYVRDYARIYGLRTVVLRQSCIYGPRQFGVEDQGWLAWFMIAAITGRPITIYGDGKQVRDVLHVDDLLDAYDASVTRIDDVKGKVYNVGGGAENVISIYAEFFPMLEELFGRKIPVQRDDWRPGDQRVFYADIRSAKKDLNWHPKIGVDTGIKKLFEWIIANKNMF